MALSDVKRWTGFSAPQSAMLWLQLSNEGYSVTQWTDRVGAVYGLHFHPEEQVHWVISGEVEITTQEVGKNNIYRLKSGDRDLIKPNVFHTLREVGGTELLYLVGVKRVFAEPKVEAVAP